ncbi:hypothetical protein BO99DRAFT_180763 [Aspergillus violaceofuscus CBS 115571]|uniref:Uncharacterized protein n=1 Tax=Aspergillus violaceofuscus (strain CBS 115571) TaxID=1450538 RepID=A0A2V5IHU8_ASPV1|nr:hypothetical protein BO99DRAFT_180763 [Aspergillus violaceofuscus CBS 115571]
MMRTVVGAWWGDRGRSRSRSGQGRVRSYPQNWVSYLNETKHCRRLRQLKFQFCLGRREGGRDPAGTDFWVACFCTVLGFLCCVYFRDLFLGYLT